MFSNYNSAKNARFQIGHNQITILPIESLLAPLMWLHKSANGIKFFKS